MAKVKPHKFFRNKSRLEQKAEKRPRQLPSISRLITEYKKIIVFVLLLIALSTIIYFAGLQTYRHYQEKEKVMSERKTILTRIAYWQKVVTEKKDYRDGYFQLAVLLYRLGRKEQAKMYLGQALKLDPNFEEGRKLEKILQ